MFKLLRNFFERRKRRRDAESSIENGSWNWAALIYEEIGDPKKAKECWLKRAEESVKVREWEWAAGAYEKLGELEKAKECWIKAAEYYSAHKFLSLKEYALDKVRKIDERKD